MSDKRVCFDFEIEFSNGGGIQGQDFRLDMDGDDIADAALADHIIADLRLLMVGKVRILNKRIIEERHKRAAIATQTEEGSSRRIDLSHVIEDGMITYKGLPAPIMCDHLSRERSRTLYAEGTEFQIGKIELVGNTGTYLDTPFHRYADGYDLAALDLERVSGVPAVVIRVEGASARAIDWTACAATEVRDRAVLIQTGWDRHWRTDQYFEDHPFLTAQAATYLRDKGALLVGIDSFNIDDVSGGDRPVHTILLGAGIPIVEHMTNLDALPTEGFRFWAVPPKIKAMGTFPVRAHAEIS
ncbi:MAG: cyclase family protein [Pseudomonadota bacterium]|uniref:cyclase family protein n=1 Tax=Sphingomonas sp. ERG5 TaxID=1381597 RepID=UPI00054C03A9|nr:cyclase family protein [Sphingomonas sp. ERG5]